MEVFCDNAGRSQIKASLRSIIAKAGYAVKIEDLPGTSLRVFAAPEAGTICDITKDTAISIGIDKSPSDPYGKEDTAINVPESYRYLKEYWIQEWLGKYLFQDSLKVSAYRL